VILQATYKKLSSHNIDPPHLPLQGGDNFFLGEVNFTKEMLKK